MPSSMLCVVASEAEPVGDFSKVVLWQQGHAYAKERAGADSGERQLSRLEDHRERLGAPSQVPARPGQLMSSPAPCTQIYHVYIDLCSPHRATGASITAPRNQHKDDGPGTMKAIYFGNKTATGHTSQIPRWQPVAGVTWVTIRRACTAAMTLP